MPNATYQIFQDLPKKVTGVNDDTPLLTVVVDQTRSPNDALLFGTTLAESLGSVTVTNWVPGTMLSVRLLTLGANGNVVADGVFDPPTRQVAQFVSAGSGTATPSGNDTSLARTAVGFDSALAEAMAGVFVAKTAPTLVDSIDAFALGSINERTVDLSGATHGSEFATPGNQGQEHHRDLPTVVMHELGPGLGHDHDADGVTAETLAAGVRRTDQQHDHMAAVDRVFEQSSDHRNGTWLGAWLHDQFESTHLRAKRRR